MLQKILLPLITVLLLSACAGKLSLVKRKYNKGYYVSTSGKHNTTKKEIVAKNKPVKAIGEPFVATETIVSKPTSDETIATSVKTIPAPEKGGSAQKNKFNSRVTASAQIHNDDVYRQTLNFKPVKTSKLHKTKKGGDADANLIVLVILCFLWFFNLIAVYIKDDHSLTLNFLITFLLDFTIIGGIIYSLLVVLDVVDLS